MELKTNHIHSDASTIDPCLDACTTCAQTCTHMLFQHCISAGGDHAKPDHIRLMADCANICLTAAAFMTRGSPLQAKVCAVCAEICTACAESCRSLDGMQDCVAACERCADACRSMARHVA